MSLEYFTREDSAKASQIHRELTCLICLQGFPDLVSLRDHLIDELEIQPELHALLNRDLGIGEEPSPAAPLEYVPCIKCKKLCKGVRGFNQHYGKVHITKKKHSVCKLCGNSFRHKYALRFHMKQVHSQAMRVQCDICGLVLYNKYMLPRHISKVHVTTDSPRN